jgi:hypothetical protein
MPPIVIVYPSQGSIFSRASSSHRAFASFCAAATARNAGPARIEYERGTSQLVDGAGKAQSPSTIARQRPIEKCYSALIRNKFLSRSQQERFDGTSR